MFFLRSSATSINLPFALPPFQERHKEWHLVQDVIVKLLDLSSGDDH